MPDGDDDSRDAVCDIQFGEDHADGGIADPVTDDTTSVIVTAVEIYKLYLPLILR